MLRSYFFLLLVSLFTIIITVADDAADARLLQAAMDNRVNDVMKELDDNGANINVRESPSGQTPLMAAVLRGNTEIVQYLLHKGADVTISEKDGYTPPHGAGFQGRADIMKLLYEHGCDL